MKIKPVIMAGGSGTRLWPLSRTQHPKQFIKMFDEYSLFQQTVIRNQPIGLPTIIIGKEYKQQAWQQIQEIGAEADFIIEPFAKNTAACAIIAGLHAKEAGYDAVLLLPADHYISNNEEYLLAINQLLPYVQAFGMCTIGVPATFPNREHGYIKVQEQMDKYIYKAVQFIEKPNFDKAKEYIEQGNYFWNSGVLIYTPSFMQSAAQHYQPQLFEYVTDSFLSAVQDESCLLLSREPYCYIKPTSVDYAIMENLTQIIMLKANFHWDDLGNWQSLWQIRAKDPSGNYCEGDVMVRETTNSYIASNGRLITTIGLDNIVIISTDDTLLVADKTKVAEVGQAVASLIIAGRKEVV